MYRQCGILNISQPYRPPQPVIGITSLPPPPFVTLLKYVSGCTMNKKYGYRVLCHQTVKVLFSAHTVTQNLHTWDHFKHRNFCPQGSLLNYNIKHILERRMPSFGMLCHVALVRTDVSEERIASIIRGTRISEKTN
jgi:hypothetical protein